MNDQSTCFIERGILLHKKYNYSKVEYKNSHTKVCIICPEHGEFWQTPVNHITGKAGCPICGRLQAGQKIHHIKQKKRIDCGLISQPTKRFIKQSEQQKEQQRQQRFQNFVVKAHKIHQNKYQYDLTTYKTLKQKIRIWCPIHGWFEQFCSDHLRGSGCKLCYYEKNRDDFLSFKTKANQVHQNKYDYSKVEYKNSHTKVNIKCLIHGIFSQRPNDHIQGIGCPQCGINTTTSKGEQQIVDFLKTYTNVETTNRTLLSGHELDIYLPEYRLAIEYNGTYWHCDKHNRIDKRYHLRKTIQCENQNIHLIHIWDVDWLSKPEIIQSRLRHLIHQNKSIGARKCNIKEITAKQAREFFDTNHLQGYVPTSIRYGLFYKDELFAAILVGKSRKCVNIKEWELVRYASKLNWSVVGGLAKLMNFCCKQNKITELISYADRCWTTLNQNVYKMNKGRIINISEPGYFYVKNNKKFHRYNFSKHKLLQKGHNANLTEQQIMVEKGYIRVYDCGQLKYLLQI